jgi:hypothetical protein
MLTYYDASHTGRFIAVIGPHIADEPVQIAPGRRLLSPPGTDPRYIGFPVASFLVDERRAKLVVDLCNLIPRTLVPPTTRLLANLIPSAAGRTLGSPRDLTTGQWLTSAGLVEWDLTATQQSLLTTNPLRLAFTQDPDGKPNASVLNEQAEGKYVDVGWRSVRLNPGDCVAVPVYARQFGRPLADEVVGFDLKPQTVYSPLLALQIEPGDPFYPADPNALVNSTPKDVFDPAPPFAVKTDANGYAELKLKVKPGPITFPPDRRDINSQLYFLGDPDGWQRWGALGPEVGAGCALSVLVFNTFTVPDAPTWKDVSPILARYARLYPFMTQVIDLADEAAVRAKADHIRERLTDPIDGIRSMPATRDMSASERDLIVRYLDSVIGK